MAHLVESQHVRAKSTFQTSPMSIPHHANSVRLRRLHQEMSSANAREGLVFLVNSVRGPKSCNYTTVAPSGIVGFRIRVHHE